MASTRQKVTSAARMPSQLMMEAASPPHRNSWPMWALTSIYAKKKKRTRRRKASGRHHYGELGRLIGDRNPVPTADPPPEKPGKNINRGEEWRTEDEKEGDELGQEQGVAQGRM